MNLKLLKLLVISLALTSATTLAQQPPIEGDRREGDEFEREGWVNNYEFRRTELLVEEGLSLMREADFEGAEQRFSDAVQISKINNGLQTRSQLPNLALQIEALIAQRDWDTADQQLSYFEWLNEQIYFVDFYEYLSGVDTLSRLLLMASADTENPTAARYLIAAKNLNWRTVSGIEATLGADSQEMAPWLYNIVLVHYYQTALTKRRGLTSYNYRSEKDEIVAGWSLSRNESLRISHSIGKELLERIRELYRGDTPTLEEALVSVHLADWEMLFGRSGEAFEHYLEAYNKLLSAGVDQERVNQFFAAPTIVPVERLITSLGDRTAEDSDESLRFVAWSPNYLAAAVPLSLQQSRTFAMPEYSARVSFNLTPLSASADKRLLLALNSLQVTVSNPDSEQIRNLVREEVEMLQFRPMFQNGALAGREHIELEYLFPAVFSPESSAQPEEEASP